MREKNHEEQPNRGAKDNQGKKEQDQSQENVGAAELTDGFLFHALVLLGGEKTFAPPVLQQIAGAQSFFAGHAVGSHASLPNRRATWTSLTNMPTPVNTK